MPVRTESTRRDLAIDATRGASMLLVFVSHFGFQLVAPWSGVPANVGDLLTILGMIASPAFMLVSGVTMATLAEDTARFDRLRLKLVDRGLFTVFVAHVLIGLADGSLLTTSPLQRNLGITDVVGLATVLAALTRVRWSVRFCLAWSVLLFALSWIAFVTLHPVPVGSRWLVGVLAGSPDINVAGRGFPLLPWLGVYFAGLALGKLRHRWTPSLIARRLGALGLVISGLGVAGWLARRALQRATGWPAFGSLPYRVFSPLEKYPPGLVYLLAFGGTAILVFAVVEWRTHLVASRLPVLLAPLGRASLFTFIAQALVMQRLLPSLHPDMRGTWPVWLAGCTAVLYAMAWWWQRHDLNRLFTLGMTQRLEWIERLGRTSARSR